MDWPAASTDSNILKREPWLPAGDGFAADAACPMCRPIVAQGSV